jgi:hypothetical protein
MHMAVCSDVSQVDFIKNMLQFTITRSIINFILGKNWIQSAYI